jgi:hypothetical protein
MTKWTKNSESAVNFSSIKHAFKVSHLRKNQKNRKNLISKIVRFDLKIT